MGLLDTGATQSVRLTAARQLGQIAGIRVAHPSGKAHGHASAQEVKLEQDDVPQGAQDDGAWSGIEGEWDQVISIVIKVRSFFDNAAVITSLTSCTDTSTPTVSLI